MARRRLTPWITTPEAYAELAPHAWSPGVERLDVDPTIWNEILDRYPTLAAAVAMNEGLPANLVDRLAVWPDDDARRAIAYRDGLPVTVRRQLAGDVSSLVRSAIVHRADLTASELKRLAYDRNLNVAREAGEQLAALHGIDARDLRPSRTDSTGLEPYSDPAILMRLLELSDAPTTEPVVPDAGSTWTDAIRGPNDVWLWISHSRTTPPAVLAEYALSVHYELRATAANSTTSPPSVLAALALDTDEQVRGNVAANPSCPLCALVLLAYDTWGEIADEAVDQLEHRFGVRLPPIGDLPVPRSTLFDPILTVDELRRLGRSSDPGDRLRGRFAPLDLPDAANLWENLGDADNREPTAAAYLVVRNQTTTSDRVVKIVASAPTENAAVRALVAVTLLGRAELAVALASSPELLHREYVALKHDAPEAALELLADDEAEEVRQPARFGLSERFGQTFPLVGRRSPQARIHSVDQFDALRFHPEPAMRREAVTRPAKQCVWAEILAARPDLARWIAINESVGPRLLDKLAVHPDSGVRGWVTRHPNATDRTLARLAKDDDRSVRWKALHNARLTDDQLDALMTDPDRRIRTEATRRLDARTRVAAYLSTDPWWNHLATT